MKSKENLGVLCLSDWSRDPYLHLGLLVGSNEYGTYVRGSSTLVTVGDEYYAVCCKHQVFKAGGLENFGSEIRILLPLFLVQQAVTEEFFEISPIGLVYANHNSPIDVCAFKLDSESIRINSLQSRFLEIQGQDQFNSALAHGAISVGFDLGASEMEFDHGTGKMTRFSSSVNLDVLHPVGQKSCHDGGTISFEVIDGKGATGMSGGTIWLVTAYDEALVLSFLGVAMTASAKRLHGIRVDQINASLFFAQ